MSLAIEPTLPPPATRTVRALSVLLLQSLKLQGRLILAIGALAVSECAILLCLLVFPCELLFINRLPFLCRLRGSPSSRLVECGLFFLESAPRALDGSLRQPARRADG